MFDLRYILVASLLLLEQTYGFSSPAASTWLKCGKSATRRATSASLQPQMSMETGRREMLGLSGSLLLGALPLAPSSAFAVENAKCTFASCPAPTGDVQMELFEVRCVISPFGICLLVVPCLEADIPPGILFFEQAIMLMKHIQTDKCMLHGYTQRCFLHGQKVFLRLSKVAVIIHFASFLHVFVAQLFPRLTFPIYVCSRLQVKPNKFTAKGYRWEIFLDT